MKLQLTAFALALAPLVPACSGPETRDSRYHAESPYAEAGDLQSMTREEFMAWMQEALEDFDARVEALRASAEAAGPEAGDAVDAYQGHADHLKLARARFAQRLHATQVSMSDGPEHRSTVIEAWQDLHDQLEQAERDTKEAGR